MRRWIPAFVLAALAAVAARPLWSVQFLFSYDAPLHLFRLFALDLTLRQGVIYPRWLLDLAYGYGYPIFDFYPPFAAYTAETLHLLGLGFAGAVKASFTFGIIAALSGAYRLGVELFPGENHSKAVGVLTAAAYVFFPYFMVGLYTRGALAEVLAVAFLPWIIWSLRRAIRHQTAGAVTLLALLLAILVVTHSLTALICTPLFGAFLVLELRHMPSRRTRACAAAGLSAMLAAALAAFYWLPFLDELRLVRMGAGMDILSDIFESNFLKPEAVIQPSIVYDYGGPPVPLGLAAMVIGAFVILGALVFGPRLRGRSTILFFGGVAALATIAVTEPARELWLVIPLSNMVQSVWRVELLANLGISVVIGSLPLVISAALENQKSSARFSGTATELTALAASALTVVVLLWTTLGNLAPAEILLPNDVFDLAHLARFEVSGASPGTTTFGEYMPRAAQAPDLLSYVAQGTGIASSTAPDIELLQHNGMEWELEVSTPAPVSIPFRLFFFPDRSAAVDGVPTSLHSSTPLGLLTVDVPAGTHRVQISAASTPARQIGEAVSILAALVAAGLIVFACWRREPGAWMLLILAGSLLLVILLPLLAALTAQPLPLEKKYVPVSPGYSLIGVTIDRGRLDTGTWRVSDPIDHLHIRAYWEVNTSGIATSPLVWRLADGSGRVWAQRAQLPRYGTAPQQTWVAREIVEDAYDLPLSAPVPSGSYFLQVSAFAGTNFVNAGSITLGAASGPAAAVPPAPENPVNAFFGNQIRLVGFDAPATALSGGQYGLTLYWVAEGDIIRDYTASVQLLAPDGKLAAQHDSITGEGLNPTSLWVPGEPVAERRQIELPAGLRPGTYTLIALMYDLKDLKRLGVSTEAGPSSDNAVVLRQVAVSGNSQFGLPGLLPGLASPW